MSSTFKNEITGPYAYAYGSYHSQKKVNINLTLNKTK